MTDLLFQVGQSKLWKLESLSKPIMANQYHVNFKVISQKPTTLSVAIQVTIKAISHALSLFSGANVATIYLTPKYCKKRALFSQLRGRSKQQSFCSIFFICQLLRLTRLKHRVALINHRVITTIRGPGLT